jgi:hypothetical protein
LPIARLTFLQFFFLILGKLGLERQSLYVPIRKELFNVD